IELLIIAGDIFDTCTPSNRAQELYYRFLTRVAGGSCRDIVVIAGNHDSPSFLSAPAALLKSLRVHVVGLLPADPADAVLTIAGAGGEPVALICAVPYLRDRDIRSSRAGESLDEKNRKLAEGVANHYRALVDIALERRGERAIPIIATGHLFAAGGAKVEGDGVRELYVGSLAHVRGDQFPAEIDYLALGHLHVPQLVGGDERKRYCGSPIPMGFGEATQQKLLLQIDFDGCEPTITTLPVPTFQQLVQVKGDLDQLVQAVTALTEKESDAWLELIYSGDAVVSDLREQLDAAAEGSNLTLLRVQNRSFASRLESAAGETITLEELSEREVFERCMASGGVAEGQRDELRASFQEILTALQEEA
ncbi:MAG: exonuclease subunit SbcD, partial [bacterium]|nr:exonuclease subunit SbcD [bacterium]